MTTTQYILALDQGTTSSRALLIDHQGNIHACAQQEFPQIFPSPGQIEHDPEAIWESQLFVARKIIIQNGLQPNNIAAIGIANQRETTVVWNRLTGKAIYNAIVWQDRRTAPLCQQLKNSGHETLFQQKTGLKLDPYFSGTKIQWILNHVKGARDLAAKGDLAFGTIDSWLMWKLTEGNMHMIEISNAARTLLFDIHRGQWDEQLLSLLDIPRNMLPQVHGSSELYTHTAPNIFGAPIPIAGIAGDQQAALFGQRCTQPGSVKNTYGTGCFMLLNTGTKAIRSSNELLTTIAWKIDHTTHYCLEGSIFSAGAVIQWLRDGLKIISSATESESLAASVENNDGVYFVPAFTGMGAPHWDPYARGTIIGLTRGTTAAHLARAAIEGIAFQVADVLEVMQKDSGMNITELRVDGAASANNLLMQFQADILSTTIQRPKVLEITALGAAYLAGLAVGFWKSQTDIDQQWHIEREFHPTMNRAVAMQLRTTWQRAVQRSTHWIEP